MSVKVEFMQKALDELLRQLKAQGLSFLLLLLMSYYFYIQNENLRKDVANCDNRHYEYIQQSNTEMIKVIHKNNLLIENFTINCK